MALLATAYERPIAPYVLEKIGRAAELWNEGEKALAHIHLSHAGLPPCTDEQVLRLFVADELLDSGVAPAELMKAQGFDLSPMALLKFNPDQPRVPAGSGRESGQWSGGGSGTPAGYRTKARMKALGAFIEWLRTRLKGSNSESPKKKPPPREKVKPAIEPSEPPESKQPPNVDSNKLHHIFDKEGRELDEFLSHYDAKETAFRAIEDATRKVITEQKITGQYKIQIEINGYKLGVGGRVMPDGAIKIGTAYPWKD
ncbi:hypothetical protein CU048_07245 [Beijerinckiaceae bacterium]|nr:hypothetical protein CU048_07245 [Beijerinckiaceae bacterium]